MSLKLIVCFILVIVVSKAQFVNPPCNVCPDPLSSLFTTTEASKESTTKGPPNRFNMDGWETDDNGNVFIGDDNAKLYLITVGSYWPFPKDYRKKRSISLFDIVRSI